MKQYNNNNHFLRRLQLMLFLLLFASAGAMAQVTVTGAITDKNNESIFGANVLVKGTSIGTVSDIDGKYSISVPDNNSILVFSFLGFESTERAVNSNTTIDVVLKDDMLLLDEAIVVAYGKQKKSHLTGAIASLNPEGLDEIPVARADQALQGKLAGVQILNINPEAGAEPIIRVRGPGSISAGSQPLIVIDGFPTEDGLSMVNMGDVESIEVLKDAASSALYGSRAAGGVILITTKSGSSDKPKYNFKMFTGISQPLKLPDMMSTEEYVELLYAESELRMKDPSVDGIRESTMLFNPITNNEKVAYLISKHAVDQPTDWVDEGMRDYGRIQNYQLSASGGTDKIKYYVSGNYISDEGIMKKSSYDKFSLRTKLDVKLSDRVSMGVNFAPTFSTRERPAVNLTDYMRFPSWMPVRHNEATAAMTGATVGEYAQVPDFAATSMTGIGADGMVWNIDGVNPWTSGNQTPVSIRERTSRIDDYYRLQTNAFLAVDILPGLTFRTSNGVNFSFREYNKKEQTGANKASNPNKLTREMTMLTDLLSENILSYDWSRGDHELNAIAGFTMQKTNNTFNRIVGTEFTDEDILSFNLAGKILKDSPSEDGTTSNYYTTALMSTLGRINYVFKGRYLLSASIRADGSSQFAEGQKWGYFPSGSVGWRISEENFMDNLEFISNFKVRVSYGLTGNNNIPPYSYMNIVDPIDYVTGSGNGDVVNGMTSNRASLGNPLLSWEQLEEMNLGVDLGFVNSRFNVSIEYYNSNSLQLLLRQPAMYITGHQSFWNNIGEVNNKGLEFEFKTTNITNKNFQWSTTANVATNKNTLLNYGDKKVQDQTGERGEVYRNAVDEESIQYFGYKSDGVYTSFEEVEAALAITDENGDPFEYKSFKPVIGGLKVKNTNGDNSLDIDDRAVIGSPFPDFTWGITNNFTYKNIDLSFLIQGVQGGEIVNGNIYYNEQLRTNRAYTDNRFVSPLYPGDGKTVYSTTTPGNQIMLTDYTIESGTYAALRDLTLGYSLPARWTDAIGLSNVRAYFSAQNLFYLMGSDYRGVNPEGRNTSGNYNNPLIDGYQRGVFPLKRTYTFGVDLSF